MLSRTGIRPSFKGALLGAALFAVGSLLMAPASAETVLTRGIGQTIGTLDPQINFLANEGWIQDDMYEGLTALDQKGDVIPGAAEKWEMSDDGLTYTFHLRDGLKWSNGDPLVAQDFVNGAERQLNQKTASYKAYYLYTQLPLTNAADYNGQKITDFTKVGINAPDPKTVVLHLDSPNPYALQLLNYYYISPLHKPSLDAYGADFVSAEHFVGNGAYVLKQLSPNAYALLVKNPNYWDAANVHVDQIKYLVTEDTNTEFKQFKAGEVDITWDVPTDRLEAIKKSFGSQLHLAPYAETDYISFNTQKDPLKDIRIRTALALAIDRDIVVNKVAKSGDKVIDSFVPPMDPAYPQLKPKDFTGDQKAKDALAVKLITEAGYGKGKPLTINYYCTSDDLHKKETEAIAAMWQAKLGVISRIKLEDSDTLYADFEKLEWDAYCDGLVGDYAGAEPFLVYRTEAAGAGYPWKNDAYEAAMADAVKLTDPAARKAALAKAEQILLDDYPLAPMLQASKRNLISKRVTGWVDNPIGYHLTKYLQVQ